MYRVRVLAAGVVVAVVALLTITTPASAHDELLSSSPTSGERFAAPPTEVTLTFSANVLDTGAAITVVDSSGRDWALGESAVVDGSVTVPVEDGMPEGGYEVRWRVVSSDGAPISGLIPFTIGAGSPLARTAAPSPSSAPVDASAVGGPISQTTPQDQGAPRVVLVGSAGAVIAVSVFALIQLLRRRVVAVDPDEKAAS